MPSTPHETPQSAPFAVVECWQVMLPSNQSKLSALLLGFPLCVCANALLTVNLGPTWVQLLPKTMHLGPTRRTTNLNESTS
jgi:hypothetical protein